MGLKLLMFVYLSLFSTGHSLCGPAKYIACKSRLPWLYISVHKNCRIFRSQGPKNPALNLRYILPSAGCSTHSGLATSCQCSHEARPHSSPCWSSSVISKSILLLISRCCQCLLLIVCLFFVFSFFKCFLFSRFICLNPPIQWCLC